MYFIKSLRLISLPSQAFFIYWLPSSYEFCANILTAKLKIYLKLSAQIPDFLKQSGISL